MSELSKEDFDRAIAAVGQLTKVIEESKNTDTARYQAAEAGVTAEAQKATAAKEAEAEDARKSQKALDAQIAEAVKAEMLKIRTDGKAQLIGQEREDAAIGRLLGSPADDRTAPHEALKASFRDYKAGEILSSIVDIEFGMHEKDFAKVAQAKARLAEFAVYDGVPESSALALATRA